ncbi:MAG: glycoside hydrolase family protein [Alphaproteobacteria bacterium]|nr:glycoside hydrolase family protein [Alphaproteobacteria bacterium]
MAIPGNLDDSLESFASNPDLGSLKFCVERNEARRHRAYFDSENIPTVGIGFNLKRRDARDKIEAFGLDYDQVCNQQLELTDEQIDSLLVADLATAIDDASDLFTNFDDLNTARQIILVDMAFNLGKNRLSGFRKMIAAVAAEDWNEAANQMMDSRWYRQVKSRGERNVEVMRTGELVTDYLPVGISSAIV